MMQYDQVACHDFFCDAIEDLFDSPPEGLAIPVVVYRERLLAVPDPLADDSCYDRQ